MAVTKAFGDSNASPTDPNQEANTGDGGLGTLGYTQIPFASQMPARKNRDIDTLADFKFTMVNQGTSFPAYGEQAETISSEDGGGDDEEISGLGEGEGATGHIGK